MIKYILVLLLISISLTQASAQHIHGTIYGMDEQGKMFPLPGANVYWMNTQIGTTTNEKGSFQLDKITTTTKLVTGYLGYKNDTTTVTNDKQDIMIMLYPDIKKLNSVTIKDQVSKNYLEKSNPLNTELITNKDIVKAACCDLSGSFENSASVDVSYSDAITGSKQIELLGLAGIYTQILEDNIPAIRGLAIPYGLSFIPGPWMNSIQISKGTSSVKNGYEAISGQINVHLKEADETEKLYVNLYGSSFGEGEINILSGIKLNKNWSTSILLHGNESFLKMDQNHDNFLDMPLTTQYNLMNRWKYSDDKIIFHLDLNYLHEDRLGGQTQYDFSKPSDSINGYGIKINTGRFEESSRLGFLSKDKPYRSFAILQSVTLHSQNSFFGLNTYDASENSLYNALLYQSIFGNTNHKFVTGISWLYDGYSEKFNDNLMNRNESVPGAFFEYTYNYLEKLTVIAGIRDDYHNLYGNFFTPRLHLKYKIDDKTTIKLSAGKGYRIANVLAENTSVLLTSKELIFSNDLKPEEAWNFGAFLNRDFTIGKIKYTFNLDYYRTNFINQVIIDMDKSNSAIYIYNLDGKSFSNSMQSDLSFKPLKNFEVFLAYRWNDVRETYHGILMEKPLTKKGKGILNLSYNTKYDKWQFDYTLQYDGKSRLPVTAQTDSSKYSQGFFLMNLQVTKRFRKFEIYSGVENLTNFTQKSPIIMAEHPFSKDFDASEIWGPVTGRKIYFGFRYILK